MTYDRQARHDALVAKYGSDETTWYLDCHTKSAWDTMCILAEIHGNRHHIDIDGLEWR